MRRRLVVGSLVVALAALASTAVAFAVLRTELIERSQAEIERQASATATILDRQLEGAVTRQDRGFVLGRTIEQIRLLGGHDYVEVAAVGDAGIQPLLDDPVLMPLLPSPVPHDGSVEVEVGGEPVIATAREVGIGSRTWLVIIGRSEPLLAAGLITKPVIAGLVAGVAMALVTALLVASRIARRVDRLGDAALRMGTGDFASPAPEDGDDELAGLGRTLNAMAEQLEAARRRERAFLMDVGHDLRTPLTTIRGYIEGLEEQAIPIDEMPRIAGVLRAQTDRLGRLVEDLMLLSRLEAHEFTIRAEPVDLAAHLIETLEGMRAMAAVHDIRLGAEVEDVGVVELDPDRIGQVLGNLVDNAVRCTPAAGTVRVRLARSDGDVVLSVADSGPGFDPEELPHVFERHGPRQRPVRPHGSGLGLPIVKGLVDTMNGRVSASSDGGAGTEVVVVLPAPPVAAEAALGV